MSDLKRIEEQHKPTPMEIGEGYSYQTEKFTGCADCGEPHPCDVVKLARALDAIMCELGVPQPGYPAPVANAYKRAERTLREVANDN